MKPTLSVISVGPGDPELITLKASRHIAQADVVAWLTTRNGSSKAAAIAAQHIRPHHEKMPCPMPLRVDDHAKQQHYRSIASQLDAQLHAQKNIAWLVLGDASLYASSRTIIAHIKQQDAIMTVPGITAFSALAARLNVSLCHKDQNISIITPPIDTAALRRQLHNNSCCVIMKVGKDLATITDFLQNEFPTIPAYYGENLYHADEQLLPLSQIDKHTAPYFATIVIVPPPCCSL